MGPLQAVAKRPARRELDAVDMQPRHHLTHRTRPTVRWAAALALGTTLLLGACSDDTATDTATDTDTPVTAAADSPDAPDTGGDASGIEPAEPCGLLDAAAVDGWLGTSGVAASTDTSLGLMGCRWATAPTDVPALLLGYDGLMDFAEVRDQACEGETPMPVPAAGPDAVACFGAVIAPAGTGVVIVDVEDHTGTFDESAQLGIAANAAAAAVA
ncbi:MAG: hypothetical protein R2713_10825 [Ilumatobacteraceae bacterium]